MRGQPSSSEVCVDVGGARRCEYLAKGWWESWRRKSPMSLEELGDEVKVIKTLM